MAKKEKTEEAPEAAAEIPALKDARARHQKNSDRYSKAVATEKAASRAAESGDQMSRLAWFRAISELDAAEAANASTANVVEKSLKKHGPDK